MPISLFNQNAYRILIVLLAFTGVSTALAQQTINPNGAWSWFGDERAIVDADRNLLYVASLANVSGAGGKEKDGDVEVARVDLSTGETTIDVLHDALLSYGGGDDHNVASLLLLTEGRVLAAYTGHNNAPITYFRTFDPKTRTWSDETEFDWDAAIPGGCSFPCTYNNLFQLSDGSILNISRNHQRCPNVIRSTDHGQTWSYAGQLLKPAEVVGESGQYVNGYLKYSQAGDQVHFLATERHPRNFSNSVFSGKLLDNSILSTSGTVVDPVLDSNAIADATNLDVVFASDSKLNDILLNHGWIIDFEAFSPDHLIAVLKFRNDSSIDDHRFVYAEFRNGKWNASELAKAGAKLFRAEEDYTGLAAIDPNDPRTVYISSTFDPSTGMETQHHEIYRGKKSETDVSFTWQAITRDSASDNMRPIIPRWKEGHTAVIWLEGSMRKSQDYNMAVKLLVETDVN